MAFFAEGCSFLEAGTHASAKDRLLVVGAGRHRDINWIRCPKSGGGFHPRLHGPTRRGKLLYESDCRLPFAQSLHCMLAQQFHCLIGAEARIVDEPIARNHISWQAADK